jgi:hypothetical protein
MNNDLSAEILHVPSSRPAPTPAHPPPVNTCSATFLSWTGNGDGVFEAPDGTRVPLHPSEREH